jgi:hypothetical protein
MAAKQDQPGGEAWAVRGLCAFDETGANTVELLARRAQADFEHDSGASVRGPVQWPKIVRLETVALTSRSMKVAVVALVGPPSSPSLQPTIAIVAAATVTSTISRRMATTPPWLDPVGCA